MPDPIVGEQQFIPSSTLLNYRTRFNRDTSGQMVVQYTTDGGATWRSLFAQPQSSAIAGYVPTLNADKDVVWVPITSLLTSQSKKTTITSVNWIDFSFPGALSAGEKFGFFRVPEGVIYECYGAQAVIFNAPDGSNVLVDIFSVDSNQQQNKVIKLTDGQIFEETFFETPLKMTSGTKWQLKTVQVGSNVEGDFLLCRLLLKTI